MAVHGCSWRVAAAMAASVVLTNRLDGARSIKSSQVKSSQACLTERDPCSVGYWTLRAAMGGVGCCAVRAMRIWGWR